MTDEAKEMEQRIAAFRIFFKSLKESIPGDPTLGKVDVEVLGGEEVIFWKKYVEILKNVDEVKDVSEVREKKDLFAQLLEITGGLGKGSSGCFIATKNQFYNWISNRLNVLENCLQLICDKIDSDIVIKEFLDEIKKESSKFSGGIF